MFKFNKVLILLSFCLQIFALEASDETKSDKNVDQAPTVMEKEKFWYQVHGSLMVLAWWGLNALSLFIVKYYKKNWPHKIILKKDMWLSVNNFEFYYVQ